MQNNGTHQYKQYDETMAATYVQITHHCPNNFWKTTPNEIGIRLTPFPFALNRPENSLIQGDKLPRCHKCKAFINKYNIVEGGSFRCPVCLSKTFTGKPIDVDSNEFKYEVYDTFNSTLANYLFTDYYFISVSLILENPYIFDAIVQLYESASQQNQVAFVFLHGALTVVRFKGQLSFQTFPFEIPLTLFNSIFISPHELKKNKETILNSLAGLKEINVDGELYCSNVIKYIVSIAKPYQSSVRLIIDDKDFFRLGLYKNMRNDALKICYNGSQISILAFTNSPTYRNQLYHLSSITGGVFKIFPAQIDNPLSIQSEILKIFKMPIFHRTLISIKAIEDCNIIDYAGSGFMESSNMVCVPKIKVGDSFFFKFKISKFPSPYLQFVIYFTTNSGVHKIRVITVPFEHYPDIDLQTLSSYFASFLSQRILVDEDDHPEKWLEEMKKKYEVVLHYSTAPCFFKAEYLLSNNKYFMQALEKSLYCRVLKLSDYTYISSEFENVMNPNRNLNTNVFTSKEGMTTV